MFYHLCELNFNSVAIVKYGEGDCKCEPPRGWVAERRVAGIKVDLGTQAAISGQCADLSSPTRR